MDETTAITRLFARKYELANRKQRSHIIDEFIKLTGFHRNSAGRALRRTIENKKTGTRKETPARGRRKLYGAEVQKKLIQIWEHLDFINSKRLVAALPTIIPILEQHGEIDLEPGIRAKLLAISHATTDRLLKSARRRLGRKGSSTTRPGKYLIDQIPIKTFTEWTETEPGHLQIDLVAHNGGDVYGGFIYTLNATDTATGWTVCTLVRDKTRFQMVKSLSKMLKSFPFPILSIHSDNGAEFINTTVHKFTQKKRLIFTRGRPYKKNDSAIIEQKNYSVVRRNTGYLRYDKAEHTPLLRELYQKLNLYNNYYLPVTMLLEKHRRGAKVTRKYDQPKTPMQRLSEHLKKADGKKLANLLVENNPAQLHREIAAIQAELIKSAAPIRQPVTPKKIRRKKIIRHTQPKTRREFIPETPNPFLERQRMEELRRAVKQTWEKRKKYT